MGHAQTFWIAQTRARNRGGCIYLRIEDIDVVRCKPHFLHDLLEDLRWFGIKDWEDRFFANVICYIHSRHIPIIINSTRGVSLCSPGWENSMTFQSRRLELYRSAWHALYKKGYIYPCKLSRRDVESALSAPHDEELRTSTTKVPEATLRFHKSLL